MRIVIDGTAGCGKTTFLQGKTDRNLIVKNTYTNIEDLGYEVFGELIRGTVDIRKKKSKDPFADWEDFFDIALERGADFYKRATNDMSIYFYDRGIPYIKVMALRYDYAIQKKYYDYCKKYRYDSPVFVFEPIASYDDMAYQKINSFRKKGFTYEERLEQHKKVVSVYRELGYEVVEVPVFADGEYEKNNRLRIEYIKKYIKI